MSSGSGPLHRAPPPRPAGPSDPYIDWGPELPATSGRPALRSLVVDPRRIFTYWEFPAASSGGDFALRLRRIAGGERIQRVPVGGSGSWYLEADPDTEYEVDLVRADGAGFQAVLTGNRVRTPRAGAATEVDPDWVPTAEEGELWRRLAGDAAVLAGFPRAGYVRPGPSHA